MKTSVYKPLKNRSLKGTLYPSVFLGGTIDNGDSVDWQNKVIKQIEKKELDDYISYDDIQIDIFNPRRDKWNPKASHDEKVKQITWELDHLEEADLIIINILPKSMSPISLMELGLFGRYDYKNVIVFCQQDYWRYENVETVCHRYKIPLYNTNDEKVIADKIVNYLF